MMVSLQNNNYILSFMKSLGNNNLIKLFLKNSPRTLAKQLNDKLSYSPIPLNSIISNKVYLNKFLVEFGC